MMLRLAFHLLSVIFAIRGTISQEICCEKKTINNVEYKLTQDEVAANPSCVNGCIYQEVGNPSSYACFVDAFNEVGCSVDVQEQKSTETFDSTTGPPTATFAQHTSTFATNKPPTDLEWCPTGEFSIQQNHLLGVIPEWGPAWKISFGLNILSFNNGGDEWGNLLRFTSTTDDCCSSVGDRIPGLFTKDNNRLQYATSTDNGNTYLFSPDMLTGKWYSLEIEQKFSEEYEQWINEITVKDDMDQKFWHDILLINSPVGYTSVSVFASDNFYNASEAIINSFHFSNGIYSC